MTDFQDELQSLLNKHSQETCASARKCLALLEDCTERMNAKELNFVEKMPDKIERWGCTEPQLQWLRDLVSKYST